VGDQRKSQLKHVRLLVLLHVLSSLLDAGVLVCINAFLKNYVSGGACASEH
jgi:hypothetical protein